MSRMSAACAGVVLLALLTGCGSPSVEPSSATSPSPLPSASAAAPATAAPTADGPSDPVSSEQAASAAPGAEWTDEELLGACKEARIDQGAIDEWDSYQSKTDVTADGAGWQVSIPAVDGSDPIVCRVVGSPSDPRVTVE